MVAAASHSAFVVVPETSGVAPAQVPALSKHAVSVPGHVAELHVPVTTYVVVLVNVPGVASGSSHSAFVVGVKTYVAVLMNVPGVNEAE